MKAGAGRVASKSTPDPERDEIGMNRHRALGYCLSMIFSENRFALCANAALRVRIMLQSIESTTIPSSSSPEANRLRAMRSNSVRYF